MTLNVHVWIWESELELVVLGWIGGVKGVGVGCLAVSWSDKYNASLCFIFVTQKIKET